MKYRHKLEFAWRSLRRRLYVDKRIYPEGALVRQVYDRSNRIGVVVGAVQTVPKWYRRTRYANVVAYCKDNKDYNPNIPKSEQKLVYTTYPAGLLTSV